MPSPSPLPSVWLRAAGAHGGARTDAARRPFPPSSHPAVPETAVHSQCPYQFPLALPRGARERPAANVCTDNTYLRIILRSRCQVRGGRAFSPSRPRRQWPTLALSYSPAQICVEPWPIAWHGPRARSIFQCRHFPSGINGFSARQTGHFSIIRGCFSVLPLQPPSIFTYNNRYINWTE